MLCTQLLHKIHNALKYSAWLVFLPRLLPCPIFNDSISLLPGERRTMAENIATSSSVRFNLLKRSAKSNMESSKKPALLVV